MQRSKNHSSRLLLVVLVLLMTGCGATPIEVVDPALVGTWQGECALGLPVVFDPTRLPEGVERQHVTVPMIIIIHANAMVEGTVGEATLQESVLKQNRGELGRRLNLATDYIIMEGYLSGEIVSGEDENPTKTFTIPFNLTEDHMVGGLMWTQPWKYPYPLCVVDLARTP